MSMLSSWLLIFATQLVWDFGLSHPTVAVALSAPKGPWPIELRMYVRNYRLVINQVISRVCIRFSTTNAMKWSGCASANALEVM